MKAVSLMRRSALVVTVNIFLLVFCNAFAAAADITAASPLDQGFHLLYNLDFYKANQIFVAWERNHPEDPLGPVSEAAGLLFSEFDRLGVLESQFYENDRAFETRKKLNPDPAVRDRFSTALDQSETRAQAQLGRNPKDENALLAMTLASGLRADYAALIEKRNMASLHYTKAANSWASKLLVVDRHCYDAYLATGISKYLVGSMSAPVRWLVRLRGVSGDKQAGISELQLTAQYGHYLAPFARIMLAIAYVREKDKARARELLASLRDEFPSNPLFAREVARLDASP
jgi:hypothetical protein